MTVATNDVVLQMRLRQDLVSGGNESSGSTSDLRRREAADSELEEVFRHRSSNHLPTAVGGRLARVLNVSTRLVASRQNRLDALISSPSKSPLVGQEGSGEQQSRASQHS